MYFVTTRGLTGAVDDKTPVSAAVALSVIRRAAGTSIQVEVRDEDGHLVTVEHLERQARLQQPRRE